MPKQVAKVNNKSDEESDEDSNEEIDEEVEVEVEDQINEEIDNTINSDVKIKKIYNRDSYKELLGKSLKIINDKKQELKQFEEKKKQEIIDRKQEIKNLEIIHRDHKNYIKVIKSKNNKNINTDGTVKLNQFTKPQSITNRFKDFYEHLNKDETFLKKFPEFDINSDQAKTNITKIIYHYIQTNVLYEMKPDGTPNKCVIIPDDALTKLFMIENGETIGFSSFKKYEKRLYDSDKVFEVDIMEVSSKKKVSVSNN